MCEGSFFQLGEAATPDDAYGRTKLAAERALAHVSGLEVVVLHPHWSTGRA